MNILSTIQNALKSKTVWGVVIAALPALLGLFNVQISDIPAFTAGATETVDGLVTLVGSAIAIYGRAVATAGLVSKKE